MATLERVREALRNAWWMVRQITGDAAYENYVAARWQGRRSEGCERRMTEEEFYVDSIRRRYSQVSRCC
jgi:uncharacterized short protein YbdD (DUF466 family)